MSASGKSRVVLIVEDEWFVRDAISQEFRDAGWYVIEASTAEDAIAQLDTGRPIDVVFTDIQLAGKLSGWDVAERSRAVRHDHLVIYTSGNAVDRSRRVPGSLFLDKPYMPSAVIDACHRFM